MSKKPVPAKPTSAKPTSVPTSVTTSVTVQSRVALCIGINYSGSIALEQCISDAKKVGALVASQGYAVYYLLDDGVSKSPTKKNILDAIKGLPGTDFFVHFSGHGFNVADRGGDETDKLDEAIYTVDRLALVDDEIIVAMRQRKGIVRCLFDNCHSGTIMDLRYVMTPTMMTKNMKQYEGSAPLILCWSACLDSQVAYEVSTGGVLSTNFVATCLVKTVAQALADSVAIRSQQFCFSASMPVSLGVKFFDIRA